VAPPDAGVQARFNVAIRTAVIDRDTGSAEYGVGGGITWSSGADAEHREVMVKTAVLHRRHRDFELLETLRFEPALGLRNLERHLERMAASADYFGFRFDKAAAVRRLDLPWTATESARVRFRLRRDGLFTVEVFALEQSADQVRLVVDDVPVDSSSRWLRHKTSQREPYDERRSRHPEADDVVLVNERGELTETSRANIAVQLHGQWWTPPLESGCLPGVERGRLLELGVIAERVLTEGELHRAEGLAVLSSLRGWRSAVLISRHGDGSEHPANGLVEPGHVT
jgi:para-aminobenzoate synthetase/4-amino-4-deoxychorismate lyase